MYMIEKFRQYVVKQFNLVVTEISRVAGKKKDKSLILSQKLKCTQHVPC
jgi:hypothetical protein